MNLTSKTFKTVSVLLLTATLTSCSILPNSGNTPPSPTSLTPSETSTTPDGSSNETPTAQTTEEGIVILNPEQVTPLEVWTPSTPNGDWNLGKAAPPGMPADIPFYNNRWIEDSSLPFTSDGRQGLGFDFNVTLEETELLLTRFEEEGYIVNIQRDNTNKKLAAVAENDTYRIVLTTAWDVEHWDETKEFIDPVLYYAVVFKSF